jgi:hypothetical protein
LVNRAQAIHKPQVLIQPGVRGACCFSQAIDRKAPGEVPVRDDQFGRIHAQRFPVKAGALPNSLSPMITNTER